MNWRESVSQWDIAIRLGKGASIAVSFQELKVREVPEAYRAEVAAIARRLGLYKMGLDILRESYFAFRETPGAAEPVMAEYAALLSEIGATRISERILYRLPKPTYAMTHFYRGLLWQKAWEYEKAVEELRHFHQQIGDEYWHSVAELNLLGALIFLHRWDEAQQILQTLELKRDRLSPMAQGILSEARGQILFFMGRTAEARAFFESSLESLKAAHSPSLLFAQKWLLITDIMSKPWAQMEKPFHEFRKIMVEQGYWEILRELDRFYALRQGDQSVLNRLYFGSPASGYRQMIRRDLGYQPPAEYMHWLGDGSGGNGGVLDLGSQEIFWQSEKLQKVPGTGVRLLSALSLDLYRPLAVGSLFEHIYQGEHFDPASAIQRVHQAIRRWRQFGEAHVLPLKVVSTALGFRLDCEGAPFAVRYTSTEGQSDPEVIRLHQSFGESTFGAAEVADKFQISRRSANRWLLAHVESGVIEKFGGGKQIRYKIKAA